MGLGTFNRMRRRLQAKQSPAALAPAPEVITPAAELPEPPAASLPEPPAPPAPAALGSRPARRP
jgi:hypothetical protein